MPDSCYKEQEFRNYKKSFEKAEKQLAKLCADLYENLVSGLKERGASKFNIHECDKATGFQKLLIYSPNARNRVTFFVSHGGRVTVHYEVVLTKMERELLRRYEDKSAEWKRVEPVSGEGMVDFESIDENMFFRNAVESITYFFERYEEKI